MVTRKSIWQSALSVVRAELISFTETETERLRLASPS